MSELLFYASGKGFEADYGRGRRNTTFCEQVTCCSDPEENWYFQCEKGQKLAWQAPGNMYAARGTLAFFWRSRYPVGPTAFPIFRVAFSDHSSWDACWLRIDYNGQGFDAFITDINLSRARVHTEFEMPEPDQWMHLTLAWDENYGIRFYVNGSFVKEEVRPAIYDTGLDQFGPHSRIISNWNVSSDYNFIRGGDIKQIAIYDRILQQNDINCLAEGAVPGLNKPAEDGWLCLTKEAHLWWRKKHGLSPDLPELPPRAFVRKVEIHQVFDLKRWWWKACDGIRETTWPGVYNRSRLKGRNDYFQLPDWDCYTRSGRTIRLFPPSEPYNHIEISGSAWGELTARDTDWDVRDKTPETLAEIMIPEGEGQTLFLREAGGERSIHQIGERKGGILCFTSREAEEPLGDISLFHVTTGEVPIGCLRERYSLVFAGDTLGSGAWSEAERELETFITGRYLPSERNLFVGCKKESVIPVSDSCGDEVQLAGRKSFYQVIIPYDFNSSLGLDGVAIEFSEQIKDGMGMAVQIKDPLWYERNLAHFCFRIPSEQMLQLWIDTRDRILPEHKCLYLTIASEYPIVDWTKVFITCVYKTAAEARSEHAADRLVQTKDLYGHLVEEYPVNPELSMFRRFQADILDLQRISPECKIGQCYLYEYRLLLQRSGNDNGYRPNFKLPDVPTGVPGWAYRQIENLKHYKYLVEWYIDHRQIADGEFGGGLSDDGDFTSLWPGLIALGAAPDKVLASLKANQEAFYRQGMITNGLSSIQADELHYAEEGLISLCQCLTGEPGNPRFLERAMETARSLYWLTDFNDKGHRHFKSCYFSGSVMALEEPWGCQQPWQAVGISPVWMLLRFNGNPRLKQLLLELADAIAAHYHPETGETYSYVRFCDDEEMPAYKKSASDDRGILYPAYQFSGKKEYYDMLPERCKIFDNVDVENHYEVRGGVIDKKEIETRYELLNWHYSVREYYHTLGYPWIDRVYFDNDQIQYDRLGGIAHIRNRFLYPTNRVEWRFADSGQEEQIAILFPTAEPERLKCLICNIGANEVRCEMTGCEVSPGKWRIQVGLDESGSDNITYICYDKIINFERFQEVSLTFAANAVTIVKMELLEAGIPYEQRCDLGISENDLRLYPHGLNVQIHNLGSIPSPETEVVLKNAAGVILQTVIFPTLEAPVDLWPRYRDVIFYTYDIPELEGCMVEIDPFGRLCEISTRNNCVLITPELVLALARGI